MFRDTAVRTIAVASCFALYASHSAFAAEPEVPQLIVTTRTVIASRTGPARPMDASLRSLAPSLKRFPYSSYRLLQAEFRPVALWGMAEFPVPGGRHLLVRPTEIDGDRVLLSVMLLQGRKTLMNTVLRLKNKGEFVVAGPEHDGGVLFLAIGTCRELVEGRAGVGGELRCK
jgi:hypothetical protein